VKWSLLRKRESWNKMRYDLGSFVFEVFYITLQLLHLLLLCSCVMGRGSFENDYLHWSSKVFFLNSFSGAFSKMSILIP